MKFAQRFPAILSVILACVLGGGLLLLTAENARARASAVPQPKLSYNIPLNPSLINDPYTNLGAFAWETFVALNWPASQDGSPLTDKKIGEVPDAPRVWEFYKTPEDVFNPSSEQSTSLKLQNLRLTEINSNETIALIQKLALLEYKDSNPSQELLDIFPDLKSVDILLEGSEPLVDRNRNYILNEVRMNPVEVAQINENHWYDAANLQNFDNKDNPFTLMCSAKQPNGTYPTSPPFDKLPCSDNGSEGTIELKAAWMVLRDPVPDEMRSKYYTTTRTFYIQTPENVGGDKTEVTVPVALVGFHISHKTSQKGWVWATFEQIDNAPDEGNLPEPGDGHYNLYSSNCTNNCDRNKAYVEQPYLWRKEYPHAVTRTKEGNIEQQIPSQISRLVSIPSIAKELNSVWQQELDAEVSNSIWKNYQLIGVQWLRNPSLPYQEDRRDEFPQQLANVTLEPYVQKATPGNSCVACHTIARLPSFPSLDALNLDSAHSDFSFLLKDAK